ncbi:hypothetical protein [Flavonifractor sp. An306]|uniref:hypothetical protein n=1 Tax=Flavonifractor sp. An306 TaxID=1965629 RepID=UPI00174BA685|nr:hypothetical protein [Flavonifractor sp. An306]
MEKPKAVDKMKLMRSEYGNNPLVRCRDCCNCQKIPHDLRQFYCIAFGLMDGYDCTWNLEKLGGCGLFNRPFHNLRPRHVPLIEIYGKQKAAKAATPDLIQTSMF